MPVLQQQPASALCRERCPPGEPRQAPLTASVGGRGAASRPSLAGRLPANIDPAADHAVSAAPASQRDEQLQVAELGFGKVTAGRVYGLGQLGAAFVIKQAQRC